MWQEPYIVQPAAGPLHIRPRLPGSKSITNRALILAALAEGRSHIENALLSDDTRYMAESLGRLGFTVAVDALNHTIEVHGQGGRVPADRAELFVGNAGTAARFLIPVLALGHGSYRLDGNARMRSRPIDPLLEALRALGVNARTELGTGCPPVVVRGAGIAGGTTRLDLSLSSQFVSALLMAAPSARTDVAVSLGETMVSEPYVAMTVRMMAAWGLRVDGTYRVPAPQVRPPRSYRVEPDASAASYFMAAAAITGGSVQIEGLGRDSLQGDVRFADVLAAMGCSVTWDEHCMSLTAPGELRGTDVDMNAISDTVMSLAVVAPFASSPTRIRNVAHIRAKECDRISAVATELRRIGVRVDEHDEGLTIYPSKPTGGEIDTYDDHRIAMSFAILGLRTPNIGIRSPGCVAKTFPDFFRELERASSSSQAVVPE